MSFSLNTSFSLELMNETNKLECHITLGWKRWLGTNTLAYKGHLQVMNKMKCLTTILYLQL
jgi:hypothetical protein